MEYLELENKFASYIGVGGCVTVNTGTAALHVALEALQLPSDSEVIVPQFTMVATAWAVYYSRLKPVFVDCGDDLLVDIDDLISKITLKTKVIMVTHIYGRVANMDKIAEIACMYNLRIIEDAAEAHGATVKGKRVGSWGHCGTFSFYGNKNLTTGEGGMITTDDEDFYNRCKHLRDHAMSKEKRYWHTAPGFNFRMTNIQAALGCAQLERVQDFMDKRQTIFAWYKNTLLKKKV